MPSKLNWATHKIPENTQQRLSYINACQDWFSHTISHQMPLGNSCVNVVSVENEGDVVDNVFYDSHQTICVGSTLKSHCIICDEIHSPKALLSCTLNPFSNIHCLVCKDCEEKR